MIKSQKQVKTLHTLLLYIAGFCLFLEWLYPLGDISETSIGIFVLFALYCFFISYFQLHWLISFPLKGFGLLVIIHMLYSETSFLDLNWIGEVFQEVAYNIGLMFSGEWYMLTTTFRSLLFLFLIWLMSYLLYYWFVRMKNIILFILLTFVYIGILDTFTVYEGSTAIVRIFVISFIALGMSSLSKETEAKRIPISVKERLKYWLLPLVLLVAVVTFIGYQAPKADPQWPDPLPFLEGATSNLGGDGSGTGRVGYGEDDSQLGGSFVQDNTVLFEATVEEDHYWRIETKDVYTGKGWETSRERNLLDQSGGQITLSTFENSVETDLLDAQITFTESNQLPKLVYPYGISSIRTEEGANFYLDESLEGIEITFMEEDSSLDAYEITYDNPSFDIDTLRDSSEQDSEEIQARYTQLPENLPERVEDLAAEVTEGYESRYDKARAVERYFSANGFEYQTTDIPIPGEEEDYVDQFLFETQIGYCDNFSTAMVVILRSEGIPARWAKGFTSGERIDSNAEEETHVNQVANSNAHSWVEVYFPDVGWVPFEPTQGFSNMADFHTDVDENDSPMEEEPLEAPELDQDEETEEEEGTEEADDQEEETASSDEQTGMSSQAGYILVGIAIVLVLILFVLYKKRREIRIYFLQRKLERQFDDTVFQEAYLYLLKLAKKKGFGRGSDETLREFARRIDKDLYTVEMSKLTRIYERMIYSKRLTGEKEEIIQLWKNLINQIMA
ncbi:transglutaminaseTgpA domain-containing protein [Oceanobacillus jeddahense]|uniref:TransglutaminaseTgpA domain-containing protein n=1 Tax=Oceanobacillus jeddahense TaxID=1462527 RepID=A0ABY5K0I0_9BACI|nr:transglutaminaseTgpA domain-containing protein [Oceanobacillus jeddahense]UUI04284.1 transglutaminaseTgpA domain-containing protein [Oceanobacillus jeddahense]